MAVLSVLASLVACGNATQPARAAWLRELIDVHQRISTQLLRLETSRDAVELGHATVAESCDPARYKEVYDGVDVSLGELIARAPAAAIDPHDVERLQEVRNAWAAVARRHRSTWSESGELRDIAPPERCLRPSASAESRLAMERALNAVLSSAVR